MSVDFPSIASEARLAFKERADQITQMRQSGRHTNEAIGSRAARMETLDLGVRILESLAKCPEAQETLLTFAKAQRGGA